MPELPEVQQAVHSLRPKIIGRRVVRIAHLRQDIIQPAFNIIPLLTDRTFIEISRFGKRIVLLLDTGNRFYIHLGMTGHLTVTPAHAPILKHTHLIADLDDQNQLRFSDPRRFGGMTWLGLQSPDIGLGPEPLQITTHDFYRRIHKTNRVIKTALLDQKMIAGVGNIYADEALHRAGIHPTLKGHQLSIEQVNKLNRAIKFVLNRAIQSGGSTIRNYADANNQAGSYQNLHIVYNRTGELCKTCKTQNIQRITLGGRSTHFCPKCQKKSQK